MKIDFLQRVVLIHSYLYYELDCSVWRDTKFDDVAKQLVSIQSTHTMEWLKEYTKYGYVFYDFDASTGFYLWDRLTKQDKEMIILIALNVKEEAKL